MRAWVVAGGLVEGPEGLLLVRNRRRDGSHDWSPPGGVIEVAEGESVRDGLTREVEEETGIRVTEWAGPVYEIEAVAEGMGWTMRCEVHRAVAYEGELRIDDPDGIVIDARFVPIDTCRAQLLTTWLPTHEPLLAWLTERWSAAARRAYRYSVTGLTRADATMRRI